MGLNEIYSKSRGIKQHINYFYKLAVNVECECTADTPDVIISRREDSTMEELGDLVARIVEDDSVSRYSKDKVLGVIRKLVAEPEIAEWNRDDSWDYFIDNRRVISELFRVYRERMYKLWKEIELERGS